MDVSRRTLDPKLDIIFKLIFIRRPNLLAPLLEAVLRPDSPITSAELLNPELPKDGVDHKGAVLDLHVRFGDGREADVEMQQAAHSGLRERALYYWARLYGGQLHPGDAHELLLPSVVVFFLGEEVLNAPRLHSAFRVLEIHDHEPLCDALAVHFIELPKLVRATPEEAALQRWCRFLMAYSDEEREALAREDPVMKEAKAALDELSADPRVRELERDRQLGLASYRITIGAAKREGRAEGRDEGRAEGRDEGRAEGRAEGRRATLLAIIETRGWVLSESQRQRIEACNDAATLERWARAAVTAASSDALFADG